MEGYVELHATSAFSFLRGASLPERLAEVAADKGLGSMALCDRMGVYGIPRFHGSAREAGIRPLVGCEWVLEDGSVLPVLVRTQEGYRNLCQLLTRVHLRSGKGMGRVGWTDMEGMTSGLEVLTGGEEGPVMRAILGRCPGRNERGQAAGAAVLDRLVGLFGWEHVHVEVQRHLRFGEERRVQCLVELARRQGLGVVATNGVLHALEEDREVLDVMACLREGTHLDAAGDRLSANGERHVKSADAMRRLFADLPQAVEASVDLAGRLEFTLENLGYRFPEYPVGPGETMGGVLRDWVWQGARGRYPGGIPEKVRTLLEKELALIHRLGFDGYFLIVADIVRYCRDHGIMAQGRGSAANSAVCFCLGITAVDPVRFNVLFERFLSESRKGWPDIDMDLPSGDQREQVIQEMYRRHGPGGAAMVATVIRYRGRSTARELGKVLHLPPDVLERFSRLFASGDFPHTLELEKQLEQAGLSRSHPRWETFIRLYQKMSRLPRHLGQHTGGMIFCAGGLDRVVPLEPASMPGRVVAQWDKDDCEDLGIIKVDLLGLGMMAVLQETLVLSARRGQPVDLARLPEPDAATYDLLQRADTVGVFQVESRAQMATLPRMKPRCFYDLVIEVAIIRPGPIQGDLAHPYLRRRDGLEPVTYLDDRLRPVLERTLGVPLFQEQMLQMAMVMAHFSGDEAEELRKALSFHRSDERMHRATARLRKALEAADVRPEVTEQMIRAVGSFALYGFPESHAISFALLAYASAWLKAHRPTEFYCALLNHQPMGFYSPATLVSDARRHGIRVLPVCVAASDWATRIESDQVLRLGFNRVQGLRQDTARRIIDERDRAPFESAAMFRRRCRCSAEEARVLASIGALNGIAGDRRNALWEVEPPVREGELWAGEGRSVRDVASGPKGPLVPMEPGERLQADYAGLRLTVGAHPMAHLRGRVPDAWTAVELDQARNGQTIRVAGQVICRQRPGTAKGVCFVSLEDETGIINVVVQPRLFEQERLCLTTEPFLVVEGVVEKRHGTIHVRAIQLRRFADAEWPAAASHDFR